MGMINMGKESGKKWTIVIANEWRRCDCWALEASLGAQKFN